MWWMRLVLIVRFTYAFSSSACDAPLGMESGQIPDEDLTASSSYESQNLGPQNGRIRVDRNGGAWCPQIKRKNDTVEWLQVDLHKDHLIFAVETQGRFANGLGEEFVESYGISYLRSQLDKWIHYPKQFTGNHDTYTGSKTVLNPQIVARKVRIVPDLSSKKTICLRVEIYGCDLEIVRREMILNRGTKTRDNEYGEIRNNDNFGESILRVLKVLAIVAATLVGTVLLTKFAMIVVRKLQASAQRIASNSTRIRYLPNTRPTGEYAVIQGSPRALYPIQPASNPPIAQPVFIYNNPLALEPENSLSEQENSPNQSNPIPCPRATAISVGTFSLENEFKLLFLDRIRMRDIRISKILANGNFGTVLVGELTQTGKKVTVKTMNFNATHEEKLGFLKQTKDISRLRDPHLAQLLGICIEDQAVGLAVEFMELGNLSQFLRCHVSTDPQSVCEKLETDDLLYICCQIASGMKFLAEQNIVHKDLAARNCIIGQRLQVKVTYFAKDMDMYSKDYHNIGFGMPVPLRWMSWETACTGSYSTKSDVWSFGMTMWEILLCCRYDPYPTMDDAAVLRYLRKHEFEECSPIPSKLPEPPGINKEIYKLMCRMWRTNPTERPTFREIRFTISGKGLLRGSFEVGLSTSDILPNEVENIYECVE